MLALAKKTPGTEMQRNKKRNEEKRKKEKTSSDGQPPLFRTEPAK